MYADRHKLRRRLNQARTAIDQGKQDAGVLAAIAKQIAASSAKREAREQNLPKPDYPAELPVSMRKDEIAAAISKHQVVIVSGETGSGKTTQLPKICLELGRGVAGLIGHTQPRRIAARSVAARIAQELKSPLGEAVGYKVRFNDKLSEASYRKMIQNLAWAAGYNLVAIPLAAGVLAPWGVVLPAAAGAALMSLSTIIVAINAQLLRRTRLA